MSVTCSPSARFYSRMNRSSRNSISFEERDSRPRKRLEVLSLVGIPGLPWLEGTGKMSILF